MAGAHLSRHFWDGKDGGGHLLITFVCDFHEFVDHGGDGVEAVLTPWILMLCSCAKGTIWCNTSGRPLTKAAVIPKVL
jgi:hypothetical protein